MALEPVMEALDLNTAIHSVNKCIYLIHAWYHLIWKKPLSRGSILAKSSDYPPPKHKTGAPPMELPQFKCLVRVLGFRFLLYMAALHGRFA